MAHTQDKKEALIRMILSKLQAHKVKILDKIVCHAATLQQYGGLIEQHFFLTYHVETRTRGAKNFCIFQDGKKWQCSLFTLVSCTITSTSMFPGKTKLLSHPM